MIAKRLEKSTLSRHSSPTVFRSEYTHYRTYKRGSNRKGVDMPVLPCFWAPKHHISTPVSPISRARIGTPRRALGAFRGPRNTLHRGISCRVAREPPRSTAYSVFFASIGAYKRHPLPIIFNTPSAEARCKISSNARKRIVVCALDKKASMSGNGTRKGNIWTSVVRPQAPAT